MADRFVTKVFDPSERQEAGVSLTDQRTATYEVMVDWNNDSAYSTVSSDGLNRPTYEDVTANVLGTPGIVIERGRDQQRANGDVMVPTSSFTLSNVSGLYNPQRGPLSASLVPGRGVRIRASFGTPVAMAQSGVLMNDAGLFSQGESTVDLFTGQLDDLTFKPDIGERSLELRALGSLLRLRGLQLTLPLFSYITTGEAMWQLLGKADYVLTNSGKLFPGFVVDDQTRSTGRLLRYWWVDGDAYEAAVQLLETEGPPAALYERGDGKIVFEGRLYRQLASRSRNVQGWYRDTDAAGYYLTYSELRYGPGLRDIVNDVSFSVDTFTPSTEETVVWEYKENLEHLPRNNAAGTRDSNKLVVVAHTDEPFYDAQVPNAALGDYTLATRTQAAGEYWAQVPTTVESVTLSQTSGTSTTITFTTTGYPSIQGLKLRAKKVPVTSTVTVRSVDTADALLSKAKFGVQPVTPNVWRGIMRNDAELMADDTVREYAGIRPTATIKISNINNAHMVQELTREVSDRIHLISSTLGIDDDYTVEQITHEIRESGSHSVTLGLERAALVLNVGQWHNNPNNGLLSNWGADENTPNVGIWG